MSKLENVNENDLNVIAEMIKEGYTSGISETLEGCRLSWRIEINKWKE